MTEGRFPAVEINLFLLHKVQTGFAAPQAPLQRILVALSSGVKQPGRETDHSPSSITVVKNGEAVTPLPHTHSLRDVQLSSISYFY
jgi:hypothetical protein